VSNPAQGSVKVTDSTGAAIAQVYWVWNGSAQTLTDSNYHALVLRPKYESDAGSCQVWATRSGAIATIHISSLVLNAGYGPLMLQFGGHPPVGIMYGTVNGPYVQGDTDFTKDFNAGDAVGAAEYVCVSASDGTQQVNIFEGNVQVPDATDFGFVIPTTTNPGTDPVVPKPGVPTYGPGDPGTTTKPVIPAGPGGTGTGGGTGSVVVTSMPGVNVVSMPGVTVTSMPGVVVTSMPALSMPSSTWPSATTLPGPSTSAGDHGGAGLADWRSRLATALGRLAIPLDAFALTGSPDMPATVTVPWFGGTSHDFTFHWTLSSVFPNVSALDALRVSFRALGAAMIYFAFMGKILRRFEVIQ
jgi:hypothetical protein